MRALSILFGVALTLLAVAAIGKTVLDGQWDDFLAEMILCGGGLVMFWFSDEFASWTGHYGVTRDRFYTDPEWYVKFSGALMVIICVIFLFMEKNLDIRGWI